jgi:hypothetical protein
MAKSKNQDAQERRYRPKISKNGPYLEPGDILLSAQSICVDKDDQC